MNEENNKECCNHNHDHEHNHEGCGCGHDHEEYQMVKLTLDDDTELNCAILGTFEVEDTTYIALLPEGDEKVLLYQYSEISEGEIELKNIESEEEFETASEAFYELFGEGEGEEEEEEEEE